MKPAEEPHVFTRLIPDLQRYTAQGNPQILPLLSQANTQYHDMFAGSYKILCEQKPVTKGEANRYLQTVLDDYDLDSFTLIISTQLGDGTTRFQASRISTETNAERKSMKFRYRRFVDYGPNHEISWSEVEQFLQTNNLKAEDLILVRYIGKTSGHLDVSNLLRYFDANTNYECELGLAAQLEVFANRSQCQSLDPNFAKKRILTALQYLLTSSDSGDFITVLCISARLDIELRGFNKTLPSPIDRFINLFFTKSGIRADTGEDYCAIFREANRQGIELLTGFYSKAVVLP